MQVVKLISYLSDRKSLELLCAMEESSSGDLRGNLIIEGEDEMGKIFGEFSTNDFQNY